jgi:ABC-type transport system involved in multi-copper enzyme maturation permease subunit
MNAASAVIRFFSFPLLAKELTEAAARRRTYVIRVIYGALLFGAVALSMTQFLWTGGSEFSGLGDRILGDIVAFQFVALALFLPALMAGSITHEKERDSLALLLLTDLRPWSIVLQKYVGTLVPVLSFLLLSMPITAMAYALGGISAKDLIVNAMVLLLTALQIGALSLMLSAWCRTTVGAFIGTYFWTVVLYAGPFLIVALGACRTWVS